MMPTNDAEIEAFLDSNLDISKFDHLAHVDMAKHLLRHHEFLEAVWIYDRAITGIANKAGTPSKRSVTKTLAFISLIAETEVCPDKSALDRWYSAARLNSEAASRQFMMPDKLD
jgi:hypothetical protein